MNQTTKSNIITKDRKETKSSYRSLSSVQIQQQQPEKDSSINVGNNKNNNKETSRTEREREPSFLTIQKALSAVLNEDVILITKCKKQFRTYELLMTVRIIFDRVFYDEEQRNKDFLSYIENLIEDSEDKIGTEAILEKAKRYMKKNKIKQVPLLVYKPIFK